MARPQHVLIWTMAGLAALAGHAAATALAAPASRTGAARISVTATVHVGHHPDAVAVNPLTKKIYVVNELSDPVSVISGRTNTVIKTVAGDALSGLRTARRVGRCGAMLRLP